jgi:hypothetical protein
VVVFLQQNEVDIKALEDEARPGLEIVPAAEITPRIDPALPL